MKADCSLESGRAQVTSGATLAVLALLFVGSPSLAQGPGAGQAPPPAVVVERIEVQEVSDPDEFTAHVEAIESVDIRARVQGFLQTVAFEAGAGQSLMSYARIDDASV
ncbi:MAG: hypothetical protein L0H63_02345 [Nitrococcus sp.]|nr:hypothetical protein [Nitrococcus sp.]